MSPFRSRPGSIVMQILVLLSPWTLLQEKAIIMACQNSISGFNIGSALPWIQTQTTLNWNKSFHTIFLMYRLVALPGRSSGKDDSLWREINKEIEAFSRKPAKIEFFLFSWQRQVLTSFGLKVGYAVHDNMMQEQRLVVDFYVSRQKAVEVSHIPADKGK